MDNDLASAVRVVDKVPPQIAWLNDDHKAAFESPIVEFLSANLINQSKLVIYYRYLFISNKKYKITFLTFILAGSCENVFEGFFDYAINCAGETRVDLPDTIYEEGVYKLSMNCARTAAKFGIKRYVEVSSGQLTANHKGPIKEDDKVIPLTSIAKYKYEVEKQMKTIPNLNFTIVRPAIVYGIGDRTGLSMSMPTGYLV